MAKKNQTAASTLGKEELTAQLAQARTALYLLRMKHQANELKTTHEIRHARKEIARIQTQITLTNS
jgi:ribosomal protein L29